MAFFKDTGKNFCAVLLDVLVEKGVKDVVCSPGSRNAPLLIGVSARNGLRKHVVVDERCAAFVALGMACVSKKPVALICTSGTALLNYAPAVAEAFYQGVPLIVISADRPEQWIDQDDSQTIHQYEALSNFVKKSYQLPAMGNNDAEMLWFVNRVSNDAMIEAVSGRPGPVHVNIRLAEPLSQKCTREFSLPRIIDVIQPDSYSGRELTRSLASDCYDKRILLVAGFMQPDAKLNTAVAGFAKLPNVTVMSETISNLHLHSECYSVDNVLTAFDPDFLDSVAPDIVISIGGALVSRKLKEYLRRNRGKCVNWAFGRTHTTVDCFMSLTKRVDGSLPKILRALEYEIVKKQRSADSNVKEYGKLWHELREVASLAKCKFIAESGWSELSAYRHIFDNIPRNANLFLSNGTAVRYAQLFTNSLPHASYCNRGVSGIDGSASTAFGGAIAYSGMTILLTGDMSMAYDVGSLALADIPETTRVIVMDNNGGGIFRFITSTSELEEREEYFCAPPNLPLKQLADGYGWKYIEAYNSETLENAFAELMCSDKKTILRVAVDGEESAKILRGYMDAKVNNQNV